jgi:hypothetical protein
MIKEQGYYKVPHILGLTASLIVRLKLSKLLFVPIFYWVLLLIYIELLKQISILLLERPVSNVKSC